MFPGFMQAAILTVIVILTQTTKHIHGDDIPSDVDESHVLTLTKDTFDDAVKNNQYLLVKFVAPWCGHCKHLVPAYAAAAKQLAESGSEIKLANVDATVEKELAQQFQVQSFPTIKFFRHGVKIDYNGGRSQEEIVNWLKKKSGPPAQELKTVAELNKLKESDEVVVIGAFKDADGDAAAAFLQVAKTIDDIPFGITSNKDVLKKLNVQEDTIVLLKTFDEGRNDLTSSFDEDSIRKFIQVYRLPLVNEFHPKTAQKVFGGDIKTHILLVGPIDDDYHKHRREFETVAKDFRGKALFITVDSDESENERIINFFGIQNSERPAVRLVSLAEHPTKYKFDSSEITSSALTKFVNAYFDGKLKPHFLSQDVPEDWDKDPVKVLVAKNFHKVAQDRSKTVLVAFVAPWCGHCKQLKPIYEELGEKYRNNSDVIIATMDATANELEDISFQHFPTIKLFPKDSDEIIDFGGERTVDGLSKFIDSIGKEGAKPAEAEEPIKKDEKVEKAEKAEKVEKPAKGKEPEPDRQEL